MAFLLGPRALRPVLPLLTLLSLSAILAGGCGGNGNEGSIYSEAGTGNTLSGDGDGDSGTTGSETGGQECGYCQGTMFYPCENGAPGEPVDCYPQNDVCVDELGCLPCV